MKINMTFKVTAVCKVYSREDDSEIDNVNLDLEFDARQAMNILYKFTPYVFEMGEFTVMINHDGYNNLQGISLHNDEKIYIIANRNQFLAEVVEGYERIRMMERLSAIVEYSGFNSSAPDSDEILEEEDLDQ